MAGTVFRAERSPSVALLRELATASPRVPSYTPEYVAARRRLGSEPWLLAIRTDDELVAGCTAFGERRILRRSLRILSCPSVPADHADLFWDGVARLCREERILHLSIDSYASPAADIPYLEGEIRRVERCEHVSVLEGLGASGRLAANHLRNVARARKAGIEIRRRTDLDACETHRRLVQASLRRRRERGEPVPEAGRLHVYRAYAEEGAGAFFQAVLDGEVVASVLVAWTAEAGYYESAGTSPEGMKCGASHLLVVEIAQRLREQGMKLLNLGGSRYEEHGLRRFKTGFGTSTIHLEAAEFVRGGWFKRRAFLALRLGRRHPWALAKKVLWKTERYVVYHAAPNDLPVPEGGVGWTFRDLSDAELEDLARRHRGARVDLERRRTEGFNGAYGVFCDGELANISWLITAEQDRLRPIRNARLAPGEAEITHGFTRAPFRGRGIWPYMLGHLSRTAGELGARVVYGMIRRGNTSSQHAVEKSGFAPCGTVLRCIFPLLLAGRAITFRGRRARWGNLGHRGPSAG